MINKEIKETLIASVEALAQRAEEKFPSHSRRIHGLALSQLGRELFESAIATVSSEEGQSPEETRDAARELEEFMDSVLRERLGVGLAPASADEEQNAE